MLLFSGPEWRSAVDDCAWIEEAVAATVLLGLKLKAVLVSKWSWKCTRGRS